MLPHSIAAIQDTMRGLRFGVQRSTLSDNDKSEFTNVLSQYIKLNHDAIDALQTLFAGTSSTFDWVELQTTVLIKDLTSIARDDQSATHVRLSRGMTWLAYHRMLWLPFGVNPFQQRQSVTTRGIARLKQHVLRIEPRVVRDISRAIELRALFIRLSDLVQDVLALAANQEVRATEESALVIQGRDIWFRLYATLGFNMKNFERVEQRIKTLETIEPIAKDAAQYLTGTIMTLKNIQIKSEDLKGRLNEQEWLDNNQIQQDEESFVLSTVWWIEKGVQSLGEAQINWNEFQKDWRNHVFAAPIT